MTIQALAAIGLGPIEPATYRAHPLHTGERAFAESNCYVDVWIEVLHAAGLDPLACMPFVFAVDWEADQWTFYKPPHEDLVELYGVGVQELNVWRPLLESAARHVESGRIILAEVDAFFLPDTQGTDYRVKHTKTTVGMQALDVEGRVLDYFHNAGYYRLSGDDFAGLFGLEGPEKLPLFAEFVRLDRAKALPAPEIMARSLGLLRKHLARRPTTNPISRWKAQFPADVELLKKEGLATYHAYAFATVRQLGSAFEFGALYLRWLDQQGERDLLPAAEDFDAIASNCKSLIMKMARAVNAKKEVDFTPLMEALEASWESGIRRLVSKYG